MRVLSIGQIAEPTLLSLWSLARLEIMPRILLKRDTGIETIAILTRLDSISVPMAREAHALAPRASQEDKEVNIAI